MTLSIPLITDTSTPEEHAARRRAIEDAPAGQLDDDHLAELLLSRSAGDMAHATHMLLTAGEYYTLAQRANGMPADEVGAFRDAYFRDVIFTLTRVLELEDIRGFIDDIEIAHRPKARP